MTGIASTERTSRSAPCPEGEDDQGSKTRSTPTEARVPRGVCFSLVDRGACPVLPQLPQMFDRFIRGSYRRSERKSRKREQKTRRNRSVRPAIDRYQCGISAVPEFQCLRRTLGIGHFAISAAKGVATGIPACQTPLKIPLNKGGEKPKASGGCPVSQPGQTSTRQPP